MSDRLAGLKVCIEEWDQTVPTFLFLKVYQEGRVTGFPRVSSRADLQSPDSLAPDCLEPVTVQLSQGPAVTDISIRWHCRVSLKRWHSRDSDFVSRYLRPYSFLKLFPLRVSI